MKLSQIASILESSLTTEDKNIFSMNSLLESTKEEITFVVNSKYINNIKNTKASAIIIGSSLLEYVPEFCTPIVVENPYWAMAILSKYFSSDIEDKNAPKAIIGENSNVSDRAVLANGVKIGENCNILAGVYVGSNSSIGNNTIIYPNVTIYKDCKIGDDCIIHSGTTVGSDGFGFASNVKGEHKKIYHNGNVVIGDDVEIGSNTSIDRAVFGSTKIKTGSRLDNLIHIAHNCEIGEYCVIAGQTGLAGSSKLGRNNVFGAQSGVAGHLEIASFNTFAARTGVTKSIKESKQIFAGFPFMNHKKWLKIQAKISNLIK